MHIKAKLYPYPVLTDFNDDYIESNFDMDVSITKNPNKIAIAVNALLENDGIKNRQRRPFPRVETLRKIFRSPFENLRANLALDGQAHCLSRRSACRAHHTPRSSC